MHTETTMDVVMPETNPLPSSVESAMKNQLRSVHTRFGKASSLHHSPLQLRHGLAATHLPLLFIRFERGLGVELDYTSKHVQTLTLDLLIPALLAVRDEGAGEGVDEGVDSLPELAKRAEDEDDNVIRCDAIHSGSIRSNRLR